MRYAQIRSLDISNGTGCGVSLFVQGCPHHCYNCFNQETWSFNGGKEFTDKEFDLLMSLVSRQYIKRFTILGGEPLAEENLFDVRCIIDKIKSRNPDLVIWLYTGYTYENLTKDQLNVVSMVDVLVDGPFIDDLKDLTLKFKGSSNQRLIDMNKTKGNNIVLWK